MIALAAVAGFVGVMTIVAVAFVVVRMLQTELAAGASQEESAKALQRQILAGMNELNDAMAKVSDPASADVQAPIIAAVGKRVGEAATKLSEIELTAEEQKRLDSVYQPQLKSAVERYAAEVQRIMQSPEVAVVFARKMSLEHLKQGGLFGRLFPAKPKSRNQHLRRAPTELIARFDRDPEPPPPPPPGQTVTIIIENLPDGTSGFVSDRLRRVAGLTMLNFHGFNTSYTYTIGPVSGVQAVLAVIDFGTITSVDEAQRKISVRADASKLPEPLPKAVHDRNDPAFYRQNLADLRQSVDKIRRWSAAGRLANAPARELRSEIAAALLDLITDSDDNTRKSAVLALPAWADAGAAVPKLCGLLGDTDASFVSTVIEALGKFKDVAAVEPLMTVADRHTGGVERALIEIGSSAEPLLLDFASGGSKKQQTAALKALGEVGGQQSLPLLRTLANSDDFFVRSTAERSLRKIKNRIRSGS